MVDNYVLDDMGNQSLSNIFLKYSGKQRTKMAVMRGLDYVQKHLNFRLRKYNEEEDVNYFFDVSHEPTVYFYELMELWEIVKTYLVLLNEKEIINYDILSMIHEMDGHNHWRKYLKLSSDMGSSFELRVSELCMAIEEIYNNKVVKFLDDNMNVEYEISLDRFEKRTATFEYIFVRYHIAKAITEGRLVVVIAGSDGLMPKRLYGYRAENNDWHEYPAAMFEHQRDILLRDSIEKKLRGCG